MRHYKIIVLVTAVLLVTVIWYRAVPHQINKYLAENKIPEERQQFGIGVKRNNSTDTGSGNVPVDAQPASTCQEYITATPATNQEGTVVNTPSEDIEDDHPKRHVCAPITTNATFPYANMSNTELHCYGDSDVATLDSICEEQPPEGRSVFFLETSCKSADAGKIVLTARQACAIESAAVMNPDYQVYVLVVSPGLIQNTSDPNDLRLAALLAYPNVHFRHLPFDRYMLGTPAESLHRSGRILRSGWPMIHASDVLRFVTLWRYSGVYLDLDVVVTSHFRDLPPDFTGRQSQNEVAAGAMGFSAGRQGRRWSQLCLEDQVKQYRPDLWSHNGPGVIERLLIKICNGTKIPDMNRENCNGFEVYPPEELYPVPYPQWRKYFDKQYLSEVLHTVHKVKIFHVWNHMSSKEIIKRGDFSASYEVLASIYCPKVHQVNEPTF